VNNPLLKAYSPDWNGFEKRYAAVKEYSWAIPTDYAIESIVAHGPIVEIGAGTGYWANLIAEAGGDIVATDKFSPSHNTYTDKQHHYAAIKKLPALNAVRKYHNRTLLMVWPEYNESWSSQALAEYLHLGGKTVIYVGEDPGGCTGDAKLHELLATLQLLKTVTLPQWAGIHDYMEIYLNPKH
jgi:hypothetical protein